MVFIVLLTKRMNMAAELQAKKNPSWHLQQTVCSAFLPQQKTRAAACLQQKVQEILLAPLE